MMAACLHIAESSDTTVKKTAKYERVDVIRMRPQLARWELEAREDFFFDDYDGRRAEFVAG